MLKDIHGPYNILGVYSTQYYVIMFINDLRSRLTGLWFSLGLPVSSTNTTDRHDILVTEILLKVALNKQTNYIRIKSKDYMTRIQYNVSEWGEMSTRELVFHYKDTTKWCFTTKIQLNGVSLQRYNYMGCSTKMQHHHHHIEGSLFSP